MDAHEFQIGSFYWVHIGPQSMRVKILSTPQSESGHYMGRNSAKIDNALEQLTRKTKADGTVDATNGTLGPYILDKLPTNPFTNAAAVTVFERVVAVYEPALA